MTPEDLIFYTLRGCQTNTDPAWRDTNKILAALLSEMDEFN